jgi:hypothetical protein
MPPLPAIDLADDASEPVIIEAAATAFGWHHDLGLIEDGVVRGRCREELDLSDLLLHRLLVGQCSSFVGEIATPWKPTRCCSCALKAIAVSCAQERKEPNASASDPRRPQIHADCRGRILQKKLKKIRSRERRMMPLPCSREKRTITRFSPRL